MDELQPSDPRSWSIEQVVYEICHNDRPLWVHARLPDIPAKQQLEEALRSNHVDGELLLELSPEDLKNELNIKSLGQRKAIEKAIRFLRGDPRLSATPAPFSSVDRQQRTESWIPTPSNSRTSYAQASPAWETLRDSVSRPFLGDAPLIPSREILPLIEPSIRQSPSANSNIILQPTSTGKTSRPSLSPARRALPPPSEPPIEQRNEPAPIHPENTPGHSSGLLAEFRSSSEQALKEEHGLLDHLRAHVNDGLRGPMGTQDNVTDPVVSPKSNPKKKQRVTPTLIGPVRSQHSKPLLDAEASPFLEEQALLMQDTFYGEEEDDDRDFTLMGTPNGRGNIQVVARRMRRFLRSRPAVIPGLGYDAVARIPYLQQDCKGYSRSYFTLFAQNVPPTIQELKDWAPLLEAGDLIPKHPMASGLALPDSGEVSSQVKVDERDSDLGEFAYLLDKYPVAENDDSDLLPAYGDSGDENEYDEETWAEMLAEKEAQKAASGFLSNQEAALALEKALDDIREQWQQTKLPRVRMKAYRLWMKVAKARKRQNDIAAQYAMRNRKLGYLEKLKYQILRDKWRTAEQLRHQCEALEETVHQIMEAEYLLTVLHSDTAPQMPSPEMIKKKPTEKSHLQDDEEVLNSDSDLESESPLVGFVVDNEGDTSVIMGDDPIETDFNPVISPGPRYSKDIHASEETASTTPTKVLEDTAITSPVKALEEPTDRNLTEPELSGSPADDADAESDASDDEILASIDKRRIKPRKLVTSEDWSSSSRPVLPDSDDENSDFDAPSRLPPSKWKSQGRTVESAIELLSSDPPQEDESTAGEFNVETPPLNPPDSDDQEPNRRPRITLKVTTSRPSVDDDRESLVDEAHARRVAALKTALESCPQREQEEMRSFVQKLISTQSKKTKNLSTILQEGLMALHTVPEDSGEFVSFRVPGLREQDMRVAEILTVLLVCYINEMDLLRHSDYSVKDINFAFDNQRLYQSEFQEELLPFLDIKPSLRKQEAPQSSKKPSSSTRKKRKRSLSSDELEIAESGIEESDVVDGASDANPGQGLTPHAKKKKRVALSKQVRDTQKDDQLRVQEQEARRQVLLKKMQRFDTSGADRQPVNSIEPLICLDDHIAARVKPHQVTGIQFLWREIVTDPKQQGCLLAHTMGLGKTMQVVSLLVTIAQSVMCLDPKVVEQLPGHLHENKTLVLCPPSLIDNWYDELLMWSPPNDRELLGMIVKISAGRSPESLTDIRKWASKGGVLIMGYETFRSLLMPGKRNAEHQSQVPEYEDLLLKTPSLVVADEAHKLKNATSKISLVARRFKTLSRIALTGSPLNNHLEEYHTMVEWIAPNYLGDMAQFRSKYVDPITAGLYADSTAYERRVCLRKLHVLKKDLEPKVNRADITAIKKDMPPKTEYIITIPLAEQQRKAYDLYVMALLNHHENSGTARTTLFKWLNKLTILANHPCCFIKLYDKYEEILEGENGYQSSTDVENQNQTEQQASQALAELTENWDPLEVKKVSDFDAQSMKQAVEVFRDQIEFHSHESPELSFRTDITRKILEKAVAVGDKTLVFSQSIPTLDYLEQMLRPVDPKLMRIDGGTGMSKRQKMTKDFNRSDRDGTIEAKIILISTRAGGLGLNLQGANRVIIFDSGFNPMWEEQAVGRAYRLGQTSPVFVYRFKCGGTFEEPVHNKALFKTQLFQRVVDKKNPTRAAEKSVSEYLFPSKDIEKQDFSQHIGRDPNVLDAVLGEIDYVHNIELTETFQKDDGEMLNEDELKQADDEYKDELLRRDNPAAWQAKQFPQYSTMITPAGSANRASEGLGNTSRPREPNGNVRRGPNNRQRPSDTVLETHGNEWLTRNGEDLSSNNPETASAAMQQMTGNRNGMVAWALDWLDRA